MKQTWKARVTALMFSVSALGVGALAVSCGTNKPSNITGLSTLYGPPDTAKVEYGIAIDLNILTDDIFRNIPDMLLILLAQQYETLEQPAFLAVRPDTGGVHFAVAEQSAETADAASSLADALFPRLDIMHVTADEPAQRWWLCEAGEGLQNYALVWNKAFLDMETQTLHADVTEENMLLLAAMRVPPSCGRSIGAFVTDDGDRLTCNVYDLCYSSGDYGLSDTATLYGFTFSAEKATGQLTGYDSDQYDFSKEAEIPDTFHPYPDE